MKFNKAFSSILLSFIASTAFASEPFLNQMKKIDEIYKESQSQQTSDICSSLEVLKTDIIELLAAKGCQAQSDAEMQACNNNTDRLSPTESRNLRRISSYLEELSNTDTPCALYSAEDLSKQIGKLLRSGSHE